MITYNQSVSKGLDYQRADIARWSHKLSAQCYLAVCDEAVKQNLLLHNDSSVLNVWRGDHITSFILNWENK